MPYYREGDPKPGWMRRREWRDRVCLAWFGHGSETMLGVALIAVGGALLGAMLRAFAREEWDPNLIEVVGALAMALAPMALGLWLIPERRED